MGRYGYGSIGVAWCCLVACAGGGGTSVDASFARPDVATPVGDDVVAADVVGDVIAPPAGLPVFDLRMDEAELVRLHEAPTEDLELPADVVFEGHTYRGVVVQLHGGYAQTVPKKSYRLEFPDEDELRTTLFGDARRRSFRRVVLQAAWIDPTFLRNKLTLDLLRELGGLAPRVGFSLLTLNGRYHGLYTIIERVDRPFLERLGLDPDGNLYKAENHNANWAAKADPMAGYAHKEGEDNPTDDLAELLDALSHTAATAEAFRAEVEPRLEVADFLRWQLGMTFAMNKDTYTKNYYLYHDVDAPPGTPEARFRIVGWDADATWGISWDAAALAPDETAWYGTDAFSPRLLGIAEYRSDYLGRYRAALEDRLAPGTLTARIDALAALIGAEAQRDLDAWGRERKFADEVARLKDVVRVRYETMTDVVGAL